VVYIDASDMKVDPELEPATDLQWMQLADATLKGQVPLYFAAVPLKSARRREAVRSALAWRAVAAPRACAAGIAGASAA
jgi:hypothetical protein